MLKQTDAAESVLLIAFSHVSYLSSETALEYLKQRLLLRPVCFDVCVLIEHDVHANDTFPRSLRSVEVPDADLSAYNREVTKTSALPMRVALLLWRLHLAYKLLAHRLAVLPQP